MTIARRFILLPAMPLLVLPAIGIFVINQAGKVETKSRFVTETQIGSLAALGNISRDLAEMRVIVRNIVLSRDQAERAAGEDLLRQRRTELDHSLAQYADTFVSSDRNRRLLSEYRDLSRHWSRAADNLISLSASGQREEAVARLFDGSFPEIGQQLSNVMSEWVKLNEELATAAGEAGIAAVQDFQRNLLLATTAAMLLSSAAGFLMFLRIVRPIQALQKSVRSIAAGDYALAVPFTHSTDETGGLARSIDVLKQSAAGMEEQRWVKVNIAKITGALQGAASLPEFGDRLLTGFIPLLGGGVAAIYVLEQDGERLRRIASYGLPEAARPLDSFKLGQGLVGQCALERAPVGFTKLPPNYLRISSGLGEAAPAQAVAWPLMSHDTLLGVIEIASFRVLNASERALLQELLPLAAMSLEILSRNLATKELLAQTQEQARRPEEQAEALTSFQDGGSTNSPERISLT